MRTYPTQHWRGWWWSEVIFWRSPHFKLGVNSQMKRGEKRGLQKERVTGRGEDIYKGLDLLMLFPKNSVALSYSGIGKILLTFISFLGKLLTHSWICSRKFLRGKIFFLKSHLFAIEIGVSPEGSSRASEWEHWQRHWNGHIHPNLKQNKSMSNTKKNKGTFHSEAQMLGIRETNFNYPPSTRSCIPWAFIPEGDQRGSDWSLFTFSPYIGNSKWLQEYPKNSVHKPVRHLPGGNISEQWLHWWWRWQFHFHMGCHLRSWWLHPKCLFPELQELGQKSPLCNRSYLAARSDVAEKKSVFFAYLVLYYPVA